MKEFLWNAAFFIVGFCAGVAFVCINLAAQGIWTEHYFILPLN